MCHMSTMSMPAACIARLAMALNSSSTGSVRQSVLRMCRSAWIGYGVVDTCARAAAGLAGFEVMSGAPGGVEDVAYHTDAL